jgi:hypothetical protein
MQRQSQQDTQGTIWSTAAIRLGGGMDLRRPSEVNVLSDLINARFLDERTAMRRDGHIGAEVFDGDSFPGLSNIGSGTWTYGHGNLVTGALAGTNPAAHCPIARRGGTTFSYLGTDVVWTGDRLLTPRSGGYPALGQSATWWHYRDGDGAAGSLMPRGIPAYLPSMADSYPPADVGGSYIETAVNSTLRVVGYTGTSTVWVYIVDRATGATLNQSEISGDSAAPADLSVFASGEFLVAMWRDTVDGHLYMSNWTGQQWTVSNQIRASIDAYDIAVVPGGFHAIWRSGATLTIGKWIGVTSQAVPYAWATNIAITGTPNGPVALGVAADGSLCAVWATATQLYAREYSASASATTTAVDLAAALGGHFTTGQAGARGLSVAPRSIPETSGHYEWVVHAATDDAVVAIRSVQFTGGGPALSATITRRYNSTLASKSFVVGDEVFCWLRSTNAGTHYLLGGVYQPVVAGYADREEATARATSNGNYGVPRVAPDPLSSTSFTWIRPHNTGQLYTHAGSVKIGDLDFLPRPTVAHFGRSVYVSGSAVHNFDGFAFSPAGFQDYPVVLPASADGGAAGGLSTGNYLFRVYAVRYNAQGERFESAAVTSSPVTAGGGHHINLVIATIPSVSATDTIVFEIYRTEAEQTAFYLEGTIANDLSVASVTFTSTMADNLLRAQQGDPHAPSVGSQTQTESWGPLGCTLLATSGDRLWGAGGQVPPGVVQFSLLKTDGFAAGFDDLAGFQEVDNEGGTITSIAGVNDATVVFELNRIYVIGGNGPDNFGNGEFSIPQIVLAAGAASPFGTVLTQIGLLYWGAEGPLLLSQGFSVENISASVRPLTSLVTPTGVRFNPSAMEVVWYTADSDAVLLNYMAGVRWARWTGLNIAGCSDTALVTTDGVLLHEDDAAPGDNGVPFEFLLSTGNMRPEDILQGYQLLRRVGITGAFLGPHQLRFRVFYDGSPLWSDEWIWFPETGTWLTPGDDVSTLTPAQVDALNPTDRSGAYGTHKRVHRLACQFFRVEVSDISATVDTFIPYELVFELGSEPGLGRVPVNTFTPGG